ncbi:MAG: PLP-dependent aminotransferase family protein [Oscillospiraceae bacterium]|jgi:2-aminoadipate transaminase|nr:PLP-dependent aminotransferase family protein [Oscillospiraceae bacterium]
MDFKFANRIQTLQPSVIREILKADPDPEMISFAAGNPSPLTFPTAAMQPLANEIFENEAAPAFQYGVTEGYTPLRTATAERISSKYGIGGEVDDLIITSGGQQAIELAAKVLCNEDDTVICESPSFIGALNAFRSFKLNLVGIETDENGMRVELLEDALRANPNTRLIYTISTFHNPGGCTLSLERRKKMLELAKKYDVLILEDSPYFELRYSGEYVPPIKSMDTEGRVIFAGSYSKVVAPGIRVGYACGHRDIISKMTVAKQVGDVHTNLFFQMLVHRFVTGGGFDAHIENSCDLYRKKCGLMLDEMDKKIDRSKADWTKPDGGLFIWVTLKNGFDGMELCRIMKRRKLTCVPGSAFCVDETAVSSGIRLNFSLPSDEQIVKGVGILARAIDEFVK